MSLAKQDYPLITKLKQHVGTIDRIYVGGIRADGTNADFNLLPCVVKSFINTEVANVIAACEKLIRKSKHFIQGSFSVIKQERSNERLKNFIKMIDEIYEEVFGLKEHVDSFNAPNSIRILLNSGVSKISISCEKMLENLTDLAGAFLHDLDEKKPAKAVVSNIIYMFPRSLLVENSNGAIPIQSTARYIDGVGYVPLLALGAIQNSSKNKLENGGLFLQVPNSPLRLNIIQKIVYTKVKQAADEEIYLNVLKEIHSAELLRYSDVVEHNLVKLSSCQFCLKRLVYLLGKYPSIISETCSLTGELPIHLPGYQYGTNVDVFEALLKAGMKQCPERFGFLFKKNQVGKRAISLAIEMFGIESTFDAVQKSILPSDNNPILHGAFMYTPELIDAFTYVYPDAIFLKDRKGRHLLHVATEKGYKLSPTLLMTIHCNKQSLEERDPVTNLYPFMLAGASTGKDDEEKNLTTVFKLLTLCPILVCPCYRHE